ncbi:MAG: hypothetical protein IPN96_14855 [Anaerolineales bacterium]|nr:hypothetical protein [Anaerolineales bacterium]
MQKLSPTLFQIISMDYLAQNFFVMIFGGWVIYAIDAVFEGEFTRFLVIFAVILTPLGLLTFFWRYRLITFTFLNGVEIEGKISKVELIAKDLILHYEYNFHGQNYQYRNRVKSNGRTRNLKPGQSVKLLAYEKTPHVAFIKNIYLETL